jgi:hypothetical protein
MRAVIDRADSNMHKAAGLRRTLKHRRLCRPLFQRLPPEEIPDGMVGCFERDVRMEQVLRREPVSGSVSEKVKQQRLPQTYIPVDQYIERQMHQRPEPVAYEQRPRVRQNKPEQKRHEFGRVQWKHQPSGIEVKVIAEEADWTWAPPLLLENQIVEIMIDVDQETAGKTTGCSFNGTCRNVRNTS